MEPAGTSEVRSRGIRIMQQTIRWRRESTHPWVASFACDVLVIATLGGAYFVGRPALADSSTTIRFSTAVCKSST